MTLPTQFSEPWAAGPDDQTPDDTCWKCGEEMDKFETRGDDSGHYGDCRTSIDTECGDTPCGRLSHEWMVHLRVDYITEIHAVSAAAAKEHAETLANNGEYNLGEVAEAIDAWHRDPVEIYGTPEHEAWLIEMERREG